MAEPIPTEAAAAAETTEEKKVGKFNHGDHMVHILIEQGKKFVPPIDSDTTCDVLIEVEVNGSSDYAPCKDAVAARQDTATMWGDHLFFEMRNLNPEDAKGISINVKVLNKGFFRNEQIGMFQFEMSTVYFAKEHKLEHVWLAMQNPDGEDASAITGMVKVSVSVQGPNDEQVKLESEQGPEPKIPKVLMSAGGKRTFNQMKIRIIEGRNMPVFGTFSATLECFVRMTYGGGKPIKTEVVDQVKNICPLMQEFLVPVQTPVVTDRMLLEIFDYNITSDTQIGSLVLSIKKLMKKLEANEGESFYMWENIYGAPPDTSGDVADMMNDNPEMASHWRGRMLLQIWCEEDDKPKKGVQKLEPEVKEMAVEMGYFQDEEYEMFVEFGQGISLPEDNHKYNVRLKVQDFMLETSQHKEQRGSYTRWSDRHEAKSFKLPFNGKGPEDNPGAINPEQRIQVYLMDGDSPISWWKGKLADFDTVDSQFKWIQLKSDRAIAEIEDDYKAGMVSVKIGCKKKGPNFPVYNFKQQQCWKDGPPRRMGAWKIRCYLFQCRDIPSADADGSSDPFIKIVSTEEQPVQTKVIDDNLNPIFMVCKDISYDFNKKEEAPPIILEVYDSDEGLISDTADFLGRAVINLADAHTTEDPDLIPRPKWHDIKFGVLESAPACGQILCSFSVVSDDVTFKTDQQYVDLHKEVPVKEYKVSINVLGLRELQPDGVLPIQKAYLKFMIKSLLDAEAAGTMQNIQTNPRERGPSPNITTLIEFKVPLPEEELFCPALSVTVFDYVFMGFSQPKVGNFTIPIGNIMHDKMKSRKYILHHAKHIAQQLQGILEGKSAADVDVSAEESFHDIRDENAAINNSGDNEEIEPEEVELAFDKEDPQYVGVPQQEEAEKVMTETEKKNKAKQNSKKAGQAIFKKVNSDLRDKQRQQQKMKKIMQVQKMKVQKQLLKQGAGGGGGEQIIIMPEYEYDNQLAVYREVKVPNEKLFLPVGYNSQDIIKAMMKIREGGLSHEEAEVQRAKILTARASMKGAAEPEEDEEEEAKKEAECNELTQKHYRTFYDDELENNKEIFKRMPFYTFDVMRGQSRGAKKSSWFGSSGAEDESGQASTLTKAGYFKGSIDVTNLESHAQYTQEKDEALADIVKLLTQISDKKGQKFNFKLEMLEHLQTKNLFAAVLQNIDCDLDGMIEFLTEIQVEEKIKEQLERQTEAMVHLYLIEGYDFASRDIGSPSDTYLYITCGDFTYNGRDDYQLDEANPKFNMHFQFGANFPGSKPVCIEAYDFDEIFGDDLIGKTSIDLDDRYFTANWNALEEKPIEARQIYHQRTSLSQGVVRMWLDIEESTKSSGGGKIWPITTEPTDTFEVRVAVYGAKGVPAADAEGTSDAYIRAFFDEAKEIVETDTHYRNTDGKPNWNYRLLFDVETPFTNPFNLKLQCWDRDLIKSNDLICQWDIDITQLIIDCKLTNNPIALQKKYFEKSLKARMMASQNREDGDVPLKFVASDKDGNPDGDIILTTYDINDTEKKKPIELKLDIRVVPKGFAETNKVGAARGDPNVEPTLPEPEGRFKLSLNPFAMLNQMCAPSMRRKIYCIVGCLLCVIACFYLLSPITAIIQLSMMAGEAASGE